MNQQRPKYLEPSPSCSVSPPTSRALHLPKHLSTTDK